MDTPGLFYLLTREQLIAMGQTEAQINSLSFIKLQNLATPPAIETNEPPVKRMKLDDSGGKLNDLPELPFELIFGHLSLKDRINCRAVSRGWNKMIDSFKVKSLCHSDRPSGFIYRKSKLVSGAFAQNFISSPKFELFFRTFGQSILANLKYLRLCDLILNRQTVALFAQTLNSLGQLEELGLFNPHAEPNLKNELELKFSLNLPMLSSIHLEEVGAIEKLTLDAPKLQAIKLVDWDSMEDLSLDIVHSGSVEKLVTDCIHQIDVKNLKNLKYLYSRYSDEIDSTLLSSLGELREIHVDDQEHLANLFDQKKRYGRTNLTIFLLGYPLNDQPDDPAIDLRYLVEHPSKLADELPLLDCLRYSTIEQVAAGQEIDVLKRVIDLDHIVVTEPVQDIERFLGLVRNFPNIVELEFQCDQQPQELFDQLTDHAAIQNLTLKHPTAGLNFVFQLKSLLYLELRFPIDIVFIRKAWKELPFLSTFMFKYASKWFAMEVYHSKQFRVVVYEREIQAKTITDLEAAFQFIIENAPEKVAEGPIAVV